MKKKFKKLILGTAVSICLIALSACNENFLEIPLPTNSLATVSAFNSKGAIDGMMNQMYIGFADASAYVNNNRIVEASSDNAYNPTSTITLNYQISNFTQVSSVVDWTNVYRNIYMANLMIEGMPAAAGAGITDELIKQYIAAAKTVRAYSYFQLVRIFGDVPLITSTDVEDNKLKGRSPKAEIYALIEKDLKEALADLPATLGAKYFINNKFIPEAILANVYLTLGRWADAEAAATDIIGSNKFQLVNVNDVFLQSSAETVSALGYTLIWSSGLSPKTGQIAYTLWPDGAQKLNGENSYPALSPDLLNSYEPGDLRRTNWVALSNTGKYPDPNNRMFCYKYKYNVLYFTGTIPAGREEDFKFIRLAEVYLIRAEARARLNNLSGAAADLNLIRTRAGLANTTAASQANMVEAVLKERRIELCFENGSRWYDLIRTNQADAVLSKISYKADNWKPFMVLFQISQTILAANPNLTQTPGY